MNLLASPRLCNPSPHTGQLKVGLGPGSQLGGILKQIMDFDQVGESEGDLFEGGKVALSALLELVSGSFPLDDARFVVAVCEGVLSDESELVGEPLPFEEVA